MKSLNKDLALRLWASKYGGVYMPPSDITAPNPHLSHLQNRDVITEGGEHCEASENAIKEQSVAYSRSTPRAAITFLSACGISHREEGWEITLEYLQ